MLLNEKDVNELMAEARRATTGRVRIEIGFLYCHVINAEPSALGKIEFYDPIASLWTDML